MGWEIYVLFGFILLFLVYLYISLQIAMSIVLPKVKSLEKTIEEETTRDKTLIDYLKDNKTKEYSLKSRYGYKLQVYEMFNLKTNKYVVISHGYTYSHLGSIKYALMMNKLGFNAILYDHRFHGRSGGKNTTLGYYEKDDLYDIISHVYKEKGKDIYLGTYGESMGSATAILEQTKDKRVKFVICDSGFKDLKTLIKQKLTKKKLPSWLFFLAINFFSWLITKANLTKVKPIEALNDANVPILFVHGINDEFISYKDTLDMYKAYKGNKMLYLGEEKANHARTYYYNKEKYYEILQDFNNRYLK
ncbi:MAG: alpha/beta hydrolase [Candidatus Izemoplasmatales bacterium]